MSLRILAAALPYVVVLAGGGAMAWALLRRPVARLRTRLTLEAGASEASDQHQYLFPWWAIVAGCLLVAIFLLLSARLYFGSSSLAGGIPTPNAKQAPSAASDRNKALAIQFSAALGVPVEVSRVEVNQFVVQADPKAVDFSTIGTVTDEWAGNNFTVNLPGGRPVSLQFSLPAATPNPGPTPPDVLAARFSDELGVPVRVSPGEANQFLVTAEPGSVDLNKIGSVQYEAPGGNYSVQLPDGSLVGFRINTSN